MAGPESFDAQIEIALLRLSREEREAVEALHRNDPWCGAYDERAPRSVKK